jgi:RimJ/RimL family protein N-acetyltransferase
MRRWREQDRVPFAAINADPRVMEHFPSTLDATQSDRLIELIELSFQRDGFGFWAVELLESGELIGFVGLSALADVFPCAPAVEVGWRVAYEHWGRGLAHEAALACLDHGFREVGLEEIVALTTVGNERSRRLMRRLGMTRDPSEDFDHPRLDPGDPLAPHVLYRIQAP